MINIFKIIGDKLKKMFSKNNTDEKGEFTFRRKPNNRINPKIRYITLYKAEKLMKV